MEEIININTFIKQLTEYLKIGIYINKGTVDEILLEKCIKLYNQYKIIEVSRELTEKEESLIRKTLKRFNLILKVDVYNRPIDIHHKENQSHMLEFEPHQSLINDSCNEMLKHATDNNINIITGIPLKFILHESKYQELLWQYTRSLFYISQMLISKVDDSNLNTNNNLKKNIFNDSVDKLENILTKISEIEEKINIAKIMSVDKFLNNKLVKAKIKDRDIDEARHEVKEIFKNKGMTGDNTAMNLVDDITEQLMSNFSNGKLDFSNGNIVQSMMDIACSVAGKMQDGFNDDPEKLQKTLEKVTEIFTENVQNNDTGIIPDNMKNIINSMVSTIKSPGNNGFAEEEVMNNLNDVIQTYGLDRNQFLGAIRNDQGKIDTGKLETYLTTLK